MPELKPLLLDAKVVTLCACLCLPISGQAMAQSEDSVSASDADTPLDSLLSEPTDASESQGDEPATESDVIENNGGEAVTKAQPVRSSKIEEIIVTATKREESVRDIPVSINAYAGEDLVARGATSLEEMVKLQPGTSKNGNRVVIRGIATSALGTYATSEEVGRFLGEVSLNAPSTRGALVDIAPFDMRAVEIAKGPQATLFGGTALAGAVRYIPNNPDLEGGFYGKLRSGFGQVANSDEPHREYGLMLNGSFGDSFGLRLAGVSRTRPGTIDDLFTGEDDIEDRDLSEYRVLALWQATSDLVIHATYFRWEEDQDDLGFTDRPDRYETRIRRSEQPSYMDASVRALRAEYSFEPFTLIGGVSELRSAWFDIVDLVGALGVEDVPGLRAILPVDTASKVPSYELRILSNAPSESPWWIFDGWEYLAGLFRMDAEAFVMSDTAVGLAFSDLPLPEGVLPGLPLPGGILPGLPLSVGNLPDIGPIVLANSSGFTETEETAFFFDIKRGFFNDKLELNLGGRLARSTVSALTFQTVTALDQDIMKRSSETEDERFNPKVALTWRPSERFSIYGTVAEGFRYGGVNANLTADIENIPRTFKSDTLVNHEIGVRTDWLDNSLQFDITAFRIDWEDLQITQITRLSAQNFSDNVGSAKILGGEANLRWVLPDSLPFLPSGLSLNLGAGYTSARIQEDFESADGTVSAGTRLPLTPRVQLAGGLSWAGNFDRWNIGASITDAYSGERKNDLQNTIPLDSYHSVGATFSLSNPSWSFSPSLNLSITNLTNEEAAHFAFASVVGDNQLFVLNRPRTVVLSLSLQTGE